MKNYRVFNTPSSKIDLRRYIDYLKRVKLSNQAAQNLFDDYRETRKSLETMADIIAEPDDEILKEKHLKRINLKRHNYFLLYRIKGDIVEITNMFHGLEDYKRKL